MNIQDWFPLRLTSLISLQSKGLSRVFSNTTVQKHQFFSAQPSLLSNSHMSNSYMTTGKTIALTVLFLVDLLCPTLNDPMDCSPPGSSVHGDSLGKNTEVGCHARLQGIFLTQGSNPSLLCLLHCQVGSLRLAPPGKSVLVSYSTKKKNNTEVQWTLFFNLEHSRCQVMWNGWTNQPEALRFSLLTQAG